MRLIDIRRRIVSSLSGVSDPHNEADAVISFIYGIDKTAITLRLFDEFLPDERIDRVISRRTAGEPLEYIVGKTVFCGYDFFVSPNCLIPQSDTEVVVSKALEHLPQGGSFLDIGTGSGCIAAVLAKERGASGVAVDISEKALEIAKNNAASLGVSDNIEFVRADIFDDREFKKRFDVVVSNPPYIKTDVIRTLSREVLHEPISALDGGDDGLIFYKRIISISPTLLKKGGRLVLEIGYDQSASVGKILSENGFEFEIKRDYGNNDRCVTAHIRSEAL